VFGRRRSGSHARGGRPRPAEAPGPDLADDLDQPAATDEAAGAAGPEFGGGPWDAAEEYPVLDRVDLGSLLVPVTQEYEVQIVFAEQQGAWVNVRHGDSQLQLQAFAAPKREGIWPDVRMEIIAEIAGAGGQSQEREGPFGPELLAQVPAQPGTPSAGLIPVRFIGVDGPRWFLRALINGPAAVEPEAAAALEALIREVVVVRGDHPMPPKDLLELRLPAEAAQALAEQQAAAAAQQGQEGQEGQPGQAGGFPFNPFERGPEMTETR
jgi:Protein of unknown function (DUF3710)